VLLQSQLLK